MVKDWKNMQWNFYIANNTTQNTTPIIQNHMKTLCKKYAKWRTFRENILWLKQSLRPENKTTITINNIFTVIYKFRSGAFWCKKNEICVTKMAQNVTKVLHFERKVLWISGEKKCNGNVTKCYENVTFWNILKVVIIR